MNLASQIVSITCDGDACGAMSSAGTTFVWGKCVHSDGHVSVRWLPENIPLLRHALQHKAVNGCDVAQQQLFATYGRPVSANPSVAPCCEVDVARGPPSSPTRHHQQYIISQFTVSEYGYAVGLQKGIAANSGGR